MFPYFLSSLWEARDTFLPVHWGVVLSADLLRLQRQERRQSKESIWDCDRSFGILEPGLVLEPHVSDRFRPHNRKFSKHGLLSGYDDSRPLHAQHNRCFQNEEAVADSSPRSPILLYRWWSSRWGTRSTFPLTPLMTWYDIPQRFLGRSLFPFHWGKHL